MEVNLDSLVNLRSTVDGKELELKINDHRGNDTGFKINTFSMISKFSIDKNTGKVNIEVTMIDTSKFKLENIDINLKFSKTS